MCTENFRSSSRLPPTVDKKLFKRILLLIFLLFHLFYGLSAIAEPPSSAKSVATAPQRPQMRFSNALHHWRHLSTVFETNASMTTSRMLTFQHGVITPHRCIKRHQTCCRTELFESAITFAVTALLKELRIDGVCHIYGISVCD